MNFENPLFILPITAGPLFFIAGLIMVKFPPKKINNLYGYRTSNSMKDTERWNFAQKYAAKIMMLSGVIYSLTAIAGLFTYGNEDLSLAIGLGLLFLICAIILIKTERKIKEKFG